jgi:hypothetical protein
MFTGPAAALARDHNQNSRRSRQAKFRTDPEIAAAPPDFESSNKFQQPRATDWFCSQRAARKWDEI